MITSWPAAASGLVRPLLARPAVRCPVVASSRTAVHVGTGDTDVPVVSVVAAGGARLPGGLVLAGPDGPDRLDRLGTVGHAHVGGGSVRVGGERVTVLRWWSQPVVRLSSGPPDLRAGADALAAALGSAGLQLPGLVEAAAARLAAAVERADESAIRSAVHAMVGLGPGLTPAADDVLVGALVCWHHLAVAGSRRAGRTGRLVWTAVRERVDRTTVVSAGLLRHASLGAGVPELLLLLDSLRGPATLPAAVDAIARIGHETGISTAYGVQLGLRAALTARAPERVAR